MVAMTSMPAVAFVARMPFVPFVAFVAFVATVLGVTVDVHMTIAVLMFVLCFHLNRIYPYRV